MYYKCELVLVILVHTYIIKCELVLVELVLVILVHVLLSVNLY